MKPSLRRVHRHVHWHSHGGALLLGVRGPVVVGHGRATSDSVQAAIRLAHEGASRGLTNAVERQLGGHLIREANQPEKFKAELRGSVCRRR